MAKYQITPDQKGLTIAVTGVAGEQQGRLTQAFQECQAGHCTCPTDEYEKLDGLEITGTEDEITLRLRAKDGTDFDTDAISACLDYTVAKTDKP